MRGLDIMKIGIQGNKGSFSEIAAQVFMERQQIKNGEIDYLISSEPVLQAVETGQVTYGIIAIENAQGGVVIESVKALAEHRCEIIDMFHILVKQNLLALPGTRIDQIKSIHSHQQALRQCRNFLADHFWGLPLIEENDTAEAARRLKEHLLPNTAGVIANKACADLYGLTILAEDIHDLKNNLTLFLGVKQFG